MSKAERTPRTVIIDTIAKHLENSIFHPDDLEDTKEVHEWISNLTDDIFETLGQSDCMNDSLGG